MKNRRVIFTVAAVLVFTVVAVFAEASRTKTTGAIPVATTATQPLDLATLPEGLPIGGAVVPATLISRSIGDFLGGDVAISVNDRQTRGVTELPAGEVTLYRREES